MSERCGVRGERRDDGAGGFTLVELLVVIGIIMLLAAVSVPALQAFRRGQRLEGAGRMLVSALNDARRRAITTHTRHVVVLFSYDEPASTDTEHRVRHGIAIYMSPIGRQGTNEHFEGGYVGTPLLLAPGIRFAQERMTAKLWRAADAANPAEPLPLDAAYFRKRNPEALAFRPDGTVEEREDISGTEPPAPQSANPFLPEEGYYQIPDEVRSDLVLVEVTPEGEEIVTAGKTRRVLVDVMPLTGRCSSRAFEVADGFKSTLDQ